MDTRYDYDKFGGDGTTAAIIGLVITVVILLAVGIAGYVLYGKKVAATTCPTGQTYDSTTGACVQTCNSGAPNFQTPNASGTGCMCLPGYTDPNDSGECSLPPPPSIQCNAASGATYNTVLDICQCPPTMGIDSTGTTCVNLQPLPPAGSTTTITSASGGSTTSIVPTCTSDQKLVSTGTSLICVPKSL